MKETAKEATLVRIENTPRSGLATAGGFVAILLWSTTVALARSLAEQLGAVTAAAAVFTVSAVPALAGLAWRGNKRRQIGCLPRAYLIGCGLLFVGYMILLFLAIGVAENREQVLEVGLVNYLWPTLTLVLTVVLLGNTARLLLLPGTLLALGGVFLVLTQEHHVSWQSFSANLASNLLAYLLAAAAAVSWALYSVLTRKWAGGRGAGGVALFLPATAGALLLIGLFVDEPRAWSVRSCIEAAVLGLATFLAYGLWDSAMRAGHVVLVATSSYLTPFLSTAASCLYLGIAPAPSLWVGCGILIAGSVLSWYAVSEAQEARKGS